MKSTPSTELINQAKRDVAEAETLVQAQFGIVKRLKRINADTQQAISLLIDLLELKQSREQRLATLQFGRAKAP
jgi:hypothetical protein